MGTFFKTFFACLVVALGFFVYKYLLSESYSPDLNVSGDNPVFTNNNKFDSIKKDEETKLPIEEDLQNQTAKKEPVKFEYICYFYSGSGKLIPVKREFATKQSLNNNIKMLLKGPTIQETRQGIYSEIPKDTDLISIKQSDDSVIINLNSSFGRGGGSQSIENRVAQLSKTVKNSVKNKKVYLYIDNKEVEYLGGDGVYIKQPLE